MDLPTLKRSDARAAVVGLAAGAITALASLVGLGSLSSVVPVAVTVGAVVAVALRVGAAVRQVGRAQSAGIASVRKDLQALKAQVAQVEAVAAFSAVDVPFPLALGGWALKYDGAAILAREVAAAAPETVVELGSGASSLIIGLQLRGAGRGHLYTLDHDPEFATSTRRSISAMGLDQWVTVVDAPLTEHAFGNEVYRWYEVPPVVTALDRVDFLVVDGPPQTVDHEGMPRYPALPAFAAQLGPGSTVFVDDAQRDAEVRMLARWASEHPDFTQKVLRTQVGTAILRRLPAA